MKKYSQVVTLVLAVSLATAWLLLRSKGPANPTSTPPPTSAVAVRLPIEEQRITDKPAPTAVEILMSLPDPILVEGLKKRLDRVTAGIPTDEKYVRSRMGNILDKLALSEAETEALLQKLVAQRIMGNLLVGSLNAKYSFQVSFTDPYGARVTSIGTYGDPAVWNQIYAQVREPVEAEIRAMLGPEKYAMFHANQEAAAYSNVANTIDRNLPESSRLTEVQTQQLIASFEATHSSPPISSLYQITESVLAEARDYLSPEQYALLKKISAESAPGRAVADEKLQSLLSSGWKGNAITEPLLIADPFQ